MKTLLATLCWLTVAATAQAGFDSSGWYWQRSMDVQSLSGFVSLSIPPEVFDESQPSLNDLRVVDENNVLAHYETTGPEIFAQTNGEIDVFVAGMGTTGTLMGVYKYLKEKKPEVKVVGVEPPECHTIQGLKNMKESIVPRIYNPDMMDEKITVEDGQAFETTRLLAAREGIFVGMSSGAAVAGALRVAQKMKSGTIVVILPDRGDRYLSTTLFRSICAKCPP